MNVIITTIIGLIISRILFQRFPALSNKTISINLHRLSIIIPARNEEKNISLLLNDIKNQSIQPFEVICVDDGSTDNTAQIISKFDVKMIKITDKPKEWMGKSFACQKGVEQSKGDLILFLDADVRLENDGIKKLLATYAENNTAISVQPYHKVLKMYEQLSMFFNIIVVGANGLGMPNSEDIGLYGPVNLITKKDYNAFGGHESVKTIVLEDLAIGIRMKEFKIPYRLFIGDEDVSFRMYSGGLLDLVNGWMKNFATGATNTPIMRLIMVSIWFSSITILPLNIIWVYLEIDKILLISYFVFYIIWVFELRRIVKKVGNFHFFNILFYPLSLFFFLFVFLFSTIKKIFKIKTNWKGRKV